MNFQPIEKDPNFKPWGMEPNTFCMLLHLSQLAFFVPLGGIVLPIVMWATNKDRSDLVDRHGKNVLNWIISSIIYAIIGGFMIIFIIGIFALIALGICSLVFIIIGAIKAHEGEVYQYPRCP